MGEQLDLSTFVGAHPTNAEFAAQLEAWGFTRLRVEGVHLIFRAQGGGRVRVLRSLHGRADAANVAKATTLLGVDPTRFWEGPEEADLTSKTASDTDEPVSQRPSRAQAGAPLTAIGHPTNPTSPELFGRLFPHGVHMTAELLSDLEQWSRLTEKIASYAEAS